MISVEPGTPLRLQISSVCLCESGQGIRENSKERDLRTLTICREGRAYSIVTVLNRDPKTV